MTKPTKFTALLPNGTTAKRSSVKATYLFAIAKGPTPKAPLIAAAEAEVARLMVEGMRYAATHQYLQDGGAIAVEMRSSTFGLVVATGRNGRDERDLGPAFPSLYSIEVDNVRARLLADYWGYILSTESNVAYYLAEIKALQDGPELVGGWSVISWSSRRDLAEKAAGSYRGGSGAEVRILPAIQH